MGWTLIAGLLIDIFCYLLFMRRFTLQPQRKGLFMLVFLGYLIYRLNYGYNASVFLGKDIVVIIMESLLVFLANRSLYSIGPKGALTESLIFVIAIQVGRKLFYHVAEPALLLSFVPSALIQVVLVAGLKIIVILPVMPQSGQLSEPAVKGLELFLLLFALYNCFSLAILNIQSSNAYGMIYANFICYLSAFLCAYLVKRTIAYNQRIAEMEKIRSAMQLQYEIWNHKKDSDDAIRIMVHDLKNQLQALKNQPAAYQALNQRLEEYRIAAYTSNSVLNAIFNEKERLAKEKGIQFTIESAFGSFDFMDDLDLCSIFANALDNAIEAAEKCDEGNRWIKLRYQEKAAALFVRIENSCAVIPQIQNGELKTTKSDPLYHGLGIKSMKLALSKYSGTLSIDTTDHFSLSILIPLP